MSKMWIAMLFVVGCGEVKNDQCGDTDSNPDHCGRCDNACAAGQVCTLGECVGSCPIGMEVCDEECVDTTSNSMYCGDCATSCGERACVDSVCETGPLGYYVLTGSPDNATVFNTIVETYKFNNNLTNSIWERESNTILTGEFMTSGYWAFKPATAMYADVPDVGIDIHARMVLIPATHTVVYSRSPSGNGVGPGEVAQFAVASINTTTGLLTPGQLAVFSDGFAGHCHLASASATEFLCFDGAGIRKYTTTAGSTTLTYFGRTVLAMPLPATAQCLPASACYGSTFAWDGAFYYFAADQGLQTNLTYLVYDGTGAFVGTRTATGIGAINGTYFDWSVGRYSTHDGFGMRAGVMVYEVGSDTHNFGAISATHTLR